MLGSQIVRNMSVIREKFTEYLIQHEAVDLTTREKINAMDTTFQIDHLVKAVKEKGYKECRVFLRGLKQHGLADLARQIRDTELVSHKKEKSEMEERMEKLELAVKTLQLEKEEHAKSIDEIRQENVELQIKNKDLDEQIKKLKNEKKELKAEPAAIIADMEKEITTLKKELDISNKNLSQERKSNAILKRQLRVKSGLKDIYENRLRVQKQVAFCLTTTPRQVASPVLPPIRKSANNSPESERATSKLQK